MKDPEKHFSGADAGTVYSVLSGFPSIDKENSAALDYDEKPRIVSYLELDEKEYEMIRSFIGVGPFETDRLTHLQ